MAVVSDDHAGEAAYSADLTAAAGASPRLIAPEEVKKHNSRDGSFWAVADYVETYTVIDGWVVDCSEFIDSHPGGLKKLLSADSAPTGATGKPYGFSFSRGKNAHFPETGTRFRDGVRRYLDGSSDGQYLPPAAVAFPPYGKVVIVGKLR